MNKVVVTGANGYIGSALIKELIEKKVSVIALIRPGNNPIIPTNNLVKYIPCRLDDIEQLINAVPHDDYDAFYHFAWQGVNGPDKANLEIQLHNIKMVLCCAEASKSIGCKKFLCAGTIAERSVESLESIATTSGGMMYGTAKHCAHLLLETHCKNIGIDHVWMQFSNIYGPTNKTGNLVSYTIDALRKGENATFGPAQQMYDFIYDKDLIRAIIRLGECETHSTSYFIGSGIPRRLSDYLLEIGHLCGATERIKIGVRPDDGVKYTESMFDTSKLKDDIGDYIGMTFEEGISHTLQNW